MNGNICHRITYKNEFYKIVKGHDGFDLLDFDGSTVQSQRDRRRTKINPLKMHTQGYA